MAEKDLCELSTEELTKQIKKSKTMNGLLIGVLVALFAITVYQSFEEKKMNPLLVTALALMPIVFISAKKIKKMKAELDSRQNSND